MLGLNFSEVRGDAGAYIKAKLVAAGVDEADVPPGDGADGGAIALIDLGSIQFGPEALLETRVRRRCATLTVNQALPLIDGESLQEDYFGILGAEIEELAAGTAVLRRTTNLAVAYIFFPDYRVVGTELVHAGLPDALRDPRLFEPPAAPPGPVDPASVAKLALPLAKALLSKIGEATGSWIFKQIFGESVPSYFDALYAQIRKIVRDELTNRDVDLISARLNGLLNWQRRVYEPKNPRAVTDRGEREKLFDGIEAQLRALEDAIAILTHDRWCRPGMSVFVIAGSMYLALCQEACYMDYHDPDPRKSSYVKTIQLTAAAFGESLPRTFQELLAARIAAVTLKREPRQLKLGRKRYLYDAYRWVEPIKGTEGRLHTLRKKDNKTVEGDPLGDATKDRDAYRSTLPSQFAAETGQPEEIARTWRGLVAQPLPA